MEKRPTAIICLTGTELTRGETHDRNGPYLATELSVLGVEVLELRLVPDSPAELERVFRDAIDRADIVISSGGLGPTADDHTVRVLAAVCGRAPVQDAEARQRMHRRALERVGSEDRIPPNYFKQAEVVEGASVLLNPVGLAPGSLVDTPRGFVAVLPGVPRELRGMFREHLVPEIERRFELTPPRIVRAKVMGIGESWVEGRVQQLGIDFGRVEYGISARPGEILLKFLAGRPEDHGYLDQVVEILRQEFGSDLLVLPDGLTDAAGDPVEVGHARLVHAMLLASKTTVATAESCTGGLVAKMLTDHADSSKYFVGSIVAYGNVVKERVLGVSPEVLRREGAVSAEVCRAMAVGVRELLGTTYGIGITGVAGPGGGTPAKPVGLVYVGLASSPGEGSSPDTAVLVEEHHFWGHRENVRRLAAIRALDLIRRDLQRPD